MGATSDDFGLTIIGTAKREKDIEVLLPLI